MKAISLWQPWATLLALRLKKNETRGWKPPPSLWNQWIAIHATLSAPRHEWDLAWANPAIVAALAYHGITRGNATSRPGSLPQRAIVALARMGGAYPTEQAHPDPQEAALGNYGPGRYVWTFSVVCNLNDQPVADVRGYQGIWSIKPPDLPRIAAAVERSGYPVPDDLAAWLKG